MTTAPPTLSLDGAKLGRAAWLTPIKMTVWLVALAYGIAWLIARWYASNELDRLSSRAKHLAHDAWWHLEWSIGLSTPLVWALVFAGIGLGIGFIVLMNVESRTQKALRYTFLANDNWLTQRVHAMAARTGLPPPRVGIMNAVNAFAVGTDRANAAVILGVPLVKGLKADELDAVIGHELGHIACGDSRGKVFAEGYQSLFGGIFATIGMAVQILLQMAVKHGHAGGSEARLVNVFSQLGRNVFGVGSELLAKGLSRKREFYADAIGAALTTPDAMQRALQRLENLPAQPRSAGENQYAYLMFKGGGGSWFSTHPETNARVKALQDGDYVRRILTAGRDVAPAAAPGSATADAATPVTASDPKLPDAAAVAWARPPSPSLVKPTSLEAAVLDRASGGAAVSMAKQLRAEREGPQPASKVRIEPRFR